jgi:hypothetical protein
MQLPPVNFSDISLLLAVSTIVILITIEISSTYYGRTNLILERQKLQTVGICIFAAFLVAVAIQVINIIIA